MLSIWNLRSSEGDSSRFASSIIAYRLVYGVDVQGFDESARDVSLLECLESFIPGVKALLHIEAEAA